MGLWEAVEKVAEEGWYPDGGCYSYDRIKRPGIDQLRP